MNTPNFVISHLELFLQIVGLLQIALAVLSYFLPKIMKWENEVAAMSPLIRDVFVIHGWFISITLIIFGVLTFRFAGDMALRPTDLSRWLCGAMGAFWGVRCVMQWLHYSPSHWRGNPLRTFIHWLLFLGYAAWTTVYFMATTR